MKKHETTQEAKRTPVQDLTVKELLREFSERMPEEWVYPGRLRFYCGSVQLQNPENNSLFMLNDTCWHCASAGFLLVLPLDDLERMGFEPWLGKVTACYECGFDFGDGDFGPPIHRSRGIVRLEAVLRAWVFAKRQEAGE